MLLILSVISLMGGYPGFLNLSIFVFSCGTLFILLLWIDSKSSLKTLICYCVIYFILINLSLETTEPKEISARRFVYGISSTVYDVRTYLEDSIASNGKNGDFLPDITAYRNYLIRGSMARLFLHKGFYFFEIDLRKYAEYAAGVSFEFNQFRGDDSRKNVKKIGKDKI